MYKHSSVNALEATRLEKLQKFEEDFYDPYTQEFSPTHLTSQVNIEKKISYRLTGRIHARRLMGKAVFLDLRDQAGRIQLYVSLDKNKELPLAKKAFHQLKLLDLGDIIGVVGSPFLTRRKEVTIQIEELFLLAKCLHPIPVVKESQGIVYDNLKDHETKYRKRYLDLMVDVQSQKNFQLRSRIIQTIRTFLLDRDFLEVETPMLQPSSGGAIAEPFSTHHNALDMPLYMRIAPELYLKKLIVGGFQKIFELNRNFRNEGIDIKHNPEFTMLELYVSYSDTEKMMELFEEIVFSASQCVSKNGIIEYQGMSVNLNPPWKRLDYMDAIKKESGLSIDIENEDLVKLKKEVKQKLDLPKESIDEMQTFWQLVEHIFDEVVEKTLMDPVMIVNHPKAISPLAKEWPERPSLTARFEPYVMGGEIGNGFSELNDPREQYQRFVQQKKENPDSIIDEEYVEALEYGLPPTGGLGIGIDRLTMLLIDKSNIRDTILFPLLRPIANSTNCVSKSVSKKSFN